MLKKLASPAWAIFEHGSYPLLLFIATPWFLHQLGTEQYGHWMLLTAVVNFGAILNTGTGASTIKAISAGLGRQQAGFSDVVVNASVAIAMIGGALLAILVFSTFWIGASAFLEKMGNPETVRLTGIAAAIIIWIEQLDNVFSSAIKGAEQFGAAARVEVGSKSIQIVVAAIVLYAFPTLTALYVSLLVVAVLRLSAKIIVSRRLLGLSKLRPSFRNASEILHFAKWGWVQGVGGALFGVADRMLVGSLLGASSLTFYSIASQLAMQIHAISAAGLSVIFPKVSRALESGGNFSLSRFTRITTIGNFLFSSGIALVLLLFGSEILYFWIGREAAEQPARILPWLVVAYWMLAMNTVFYYLLLGMGRIRFISLTVIVSGVFAALAAYFAILAFGLVGAPAGRAVYAILSLALAVPVLRQLRHERNSASIAPAVVPAADRGPIL